MFNTKSMIKAFREEESFQVEEGINNSSKSVMQVELEELGVSIRGGTSQ